MDLDRMVRVYGNIQAARKKLKADYETQDTELSNKLNIIETEMLRFLIDTKGKSHTTEAGSFRRETKIIPGIADFDAICRFVEAEGAWEIFERRLKQKFVKDYLEENNNTPPPGVSLFRKTEIKVTPKR